MPWLPAPVTFGEFISSVKMDGDTLSFASQQAVGHDFIQLGIKYKDHPHSTLWNLTPDA